jgi:CheY-like chemotaxis protein
MADNDDLLDIVDDDGAEPVQELDPQRWKVAIIDDDPAVHSGTRFALYDYRLNGQGIELLSAYSAAEGRVLLADNPDIAVILLDVVMEHDSAGLELVDHIRNEHAQRHRAHHPAHRPAGSGARAQRDRRLRHQ